MFGGGKDPYVTKTGQSATTGTITVNGQQATVAVTPGPSTVVAGRGGVRFELKAVNGSLEGIKPEWRILKDPNAATIDENGHAVFPKPGEVTIAAVIPGEAKNEPFYFLSSIGKVAHGGEFFDPKNFDVLGLLIAFAVTMYLSSALMSPAGSTANMDPEQAAIQKQTQQTMPIMVTAMFFFFPLPAGVFLYLVVSNVVQTFQTWLIYRTPAPAFIDVTDDDGPGPDTGSNGGGGTIIDVGGGDDSGTKISAPQKQGKKKK
jgi:YidC/Oxa1 family membrane protein insertase